jgi:hypothetical protein
LKLLCRQSGENAWMILSLVKMPRLLRFSPEMAHSFPLQVLVSRIYAEGLSGAADARMIVKGITLYVARLGSFPPPLFRALRESLNRCEDMVRFSFFELLIQCCGCFLTLGWSQSTFW